MVEYLPSKQATWVRFPSPALETTAGKFEVAALLKVVEFKKWVAPAARDVVPNAAVAQSVERVLGKDEVLGSNPSGSFRRSGAATDAGRTCGDGGLDDFRETDEGGARVGSRGVRNVF